MPIALTVTVRSLVVCLRGCVPALILSFACTQNARAPVLGNGERERACTRERSEAIVSLTRRAQVMRVGVYNLNRFRLSFPTEGGKDVAAFPPLDFSTSTTFQRLLHVEPPVSS